MTYIEILGVMGTGKTSLSKVFNEKAGATVIIEKEEDLKRMFLLEPYIADPQKYGFEGAINFVAFNLNKIQEELVKLPKDECVVVDTSMLMQYAYSKPVLNEAEFKTICETINLAYAKLPPVDLRIVITLPPDVHLQRIKDRGRDFEQNVTEERLTEVQNLLDESIKKMGAGVPTIYLDGSKLDWVHSEKDKKAVIDLVKKKCPHLKMG